MGMGVMVSFISVDGWCRGRDINNNNKNKENNNKSFYFYKIVRISKILWLWKIRKGIEFF